MKIVKRLLYGLLVAIPLMLLTYAIASAQTQTQPELQTTQTLECGACHTEFEQAWINGAHGRATSDPTFNQAWQEQGRPAECLECHVTGYDEETGTWKADGISCIACHDPIPANHPLEPMPTDRSGKTCGDCHAETFFEWQISAHREKGVDCAGCHDPHQTGLVMESPSALCSSCHRGRASNFAHSQHSQHGLACSDCHLNPLDTTGEQGHARRDHSFFVSLTTCNRCHAYQMHDPVEVHPEQPTPVPPDAIASVQNVEVHAEPVATSPIAFTTLSGIVGVALGIIIAPLFERLQRRSRGVEENGKEDEEAGG
jgi:predicted CXXCH cytochrome family protein